MASLRNIYRVVGWCCTSLLISSVVAHAADHDAFFADTLQPTIKQHCVKCHGLKGKVKGKVNLLEVTNAQTLSKDLDLLDQMLEALDSQEMPPEDEEPLDPKLRTELVAQLQKMLHEAVAAQDTVAQAPIRRMNRFQYSNAVQDLFDLNVVVYSLPERMIRDYGYFKPASGKMPDKFKAGCRPLGKSQLIEPRLADVTPFPQDLRAEHGFDNRGDHLSLSPLLMESFLDLGHSVVESRTFGPKNVGIWKTFFEPPPAGSDTRAIVRDRLRPFLTRAFRRPVNDDSLDRFVAHATGLIESGTSFTDSMKAIAAATIASPRFLYIYDRGGSDDSVEMIDDFEMASRLSFFLWGSIPDKTLLDLAMAGKLQEPKVLDEQLDRMLNDVRLKRFCDSFPAQWLQLERIISSTPDPKKHPQFYFGGGEYKVSMHMVMEPLLVFETILIEDRSILELIDAPFTYRSDLLKSWYESGKQRSARPTAIPFERVKITDRRQGGMITNTAVMTMTSGPQRSHPITRGAWLATVIFNNPPPPPPGDVPPLPEDEHDTSKLTIRERLAVHRKREDCAGCHEKIDPLGFALENYGPTGLWRDKYPNGRDVDMSGALFRQHKFAHVTEFKDAILKDKPRFTRAFAGHLLSFALARNVEASDAVVLDDITAKTEETNFRIRAMIKHVAKSDAFRQKYTGTIE